MLDITGTPVDKLAPLLVEKIKTNLCGNLCHLQVALHILIRS